MAKWVKNNTAIQKTYVGKDIPAGTYREVDSDLWTADSTLLTDIGSGDAVIAKDSSGTTDIIDVNEAINYLKDNIAQEVIITKQAEQHPFATPDYRTKRDATVAIESIPINDNKSIDFQLISEKYVSGGKMIIKNAEFGDYCTAEVHDTDSVIPVAYRAALCENWPTVSTYIIKEWIESTNNSLCKHTINTKPLNARITAGLYLRVTYYAINVGVTREVLINYDLTERLI